MWRSSTMNNGWGRRRCSRRCSTSTSADKLSLLDAPIPKVQPLRQNSPAVLHQYSSSACFPGVFQQFFPSRDSTIRASMVSQCCYLSTSFLPLFLYSFLFSVRNALCFSPHYSNLNTLPLSSPSTQTKPRGACSYSLFLLCFIFYLMTQNYPLRVSSFQPRIGKKGRELERTHG